MSTVHKLTLLNLMRYFMVVLRRIFLEKASWSLMVSQDWPMALIGLAVLTAEAWLFRHQID